MKKEKFDYIFNNIARIVMTDDDREMSKFVEKIFSLFSFYYDFLVSVQNIVETIEF